MKEILSKSEYSMISHPKISISILTYNRRPSLELLLESLSSISYRPMEIIVVDNHSEDGTAEMLADRYPEIIHIRTIKNEGADARNHGLRVATGEIVVTLDDDIIGIDDKALMMLVNLFDQQQGVAAVNFKVFAFDTGRICNWVHHCQVEVNADREFETYEITEGAVAFRRSVFEKAGYYPEGFFISHEGPDLAFRIMNCGFQVIYSPIICVQHHHSDSGRKSWYNYYYDTRNQLWLSARHFPLSYAAIYLFRGLLSMMVYSVRDGYFRFWTKGVLDGLRGLGKAFESRTPLKRKTLNKLRQIDRQRPSLMYMIKKRLINKNARL